MSTERMIEIDGSEGEGGGQILRTSLALSIITGTPVRIYNVRARRSRPGLMRQHLTAVQAAAIVGAAHVVGDRLHSMEVVFRPGTIIGGRHRFAIGTAGSTTLVLQTIVFPLLLADRDSTVELEGGTHNPLAPPVDFLQKSWAPALAAMGARVQIDLQRHGFYPAGGGRLTVQIGGRTELSPIERLHRGRLEPASARACVANLSASIARRELEVVHERLSWSRTRLHVAEVDADGPGNVLLLEQPHEAGITIVSSMGEKGRRAEDVATAACDELQRFLAAEVPVDEHLADQLLVPMALAGGGSFRTLHATPHTTTNAAVIERFLPVRFAIAHEEGGTTRVSVARA
jgi:RNA 3'-terminal phosphate cyclase (ATP)